MSVLLVLKVRMLQETNLLSIFRDSLHIDDMFCLIIAQMVSMGRRKFGTDFQVMFRILKALLFLGFLSVMTVLFVVCGLTISDLCASFLAFLPTGWAILLVSSVPQTFSAFSFV